MDDPVDPYTIARSRKLQQRLELRPYDQSAIEELIEISYAEHNQEACISAIEKSFELELGTSGRLFVLLGRCYARIWKKTGTVSGKHIRFASFVTY